MWARLRSSVGRNSNTQSKQRTLISLSSLSSELDCEDWRAVIALYTKGSKETRERVFGEIDFDQDSLKYAAASSELMCLPEKLCDLLGKMETSEEQENGLLDMASGICSDENRTELY